jgi:hypothetical protein
MLHCGPNGLNPNVLFELGYALAHRKRIWILLDTEIEKAKMGCIIAHLNNGEHAIVNRNGHTLLTSKALHSGLFSITINGRALHTGLSMACPIPAGSSARAPARFEPDSTNPSPNLGAALEDLSRMGFGGYWKREFRPCLRAAAVQFAPNTHR